MSIIILVAKGNRYKSFSIIIFSTYILTTMYPFYLDLLLLFTTKCQTINIGKPRYMLPCAYLALPTIYILLSLVSMKSLLCFNARQGYRYLKISYYPSINRILIYQYLGISIKPQQSINRALKQSTRCQYYILTLGGLKAKILLSSFPSLIISISRLRPTRLQSLLAIQYMLLNSTTTILPS